MAYSRDSKSAAVRSRLDHPVIDGDGHWLEPVPILVDYLRQVAGPSVADRYVKKNTEAGWYEWTPAERMERRVHRPTWWGEPARTIDRATAMIPRLFYERLDDFGIDFCLLYTSLGLFNVGNPDEELRRGVSRAVNVMNAEMFKPYADRIAPAAVVPVHTPQEAIEEAQYAVRELGFKVIMIANHVRRPVPTAARQTTDPANARQFVDSLALDSAHDYDPFWRACVDLKVAVTAHSGSMGWNGRESVNSFTYNHIGHFANASHAFAKALILGGVTRRFPSLRFAMLEGGVGWACNLVTDLVSHWEKRRREACEANLNPSNLDVAMLRDLFVKYGGDGYEKKLDELIGSVSLVPPFKTIQEMTERERREDWDDFGAVQAASAEELRREFAGHFYFGCEADDPTTAWAFDTHGHHRLNPIFSSDVGHFDVTDMTEVLEEAHELVEDGLITAADFREFTFENAARLHTALNPDFFRGTVVESAVARLRG
ncbi:MAG: amidohydrolase family protein [Candidatus Rokubacteria bacterium]|nr:amidohydrolase family protein [Candidatus Rokubacteria bacterium]MBI3824938.1 amidohydrolase family protein [Candidatus Rokubacteria bacterium]